jgi:glycogen debranching enzyme
MFINAVQFALDWARTEKHTGFINTWQPLAKTAPEAFMKTFWSEQHGYLADTHDGQTSDFSLRPNQLWALALPTQVVPTKAAKTILEHVRKELLTPVGLRTLAPSAYQYVAQYGGVQRDRDFAYHQGSVWPWLLGIYADAINNVLGAKAMKAEIKPVIERLEKHFYEEACLGQISELFNADVPHAAGGAPAQAWSVAELLRITSMMKMTKDRKPS